MITKMKYLVLLVFCFDVKAEALRTNKNKCGDVIGPRCGVGYDNEEIVTNENNIVRPCCVHDIKCIRKFLADNSKCKPAYSPVQDPLYLAQTTFYLAYADVTFTYTNYTTSGLNNGSIFSFYYDTITKKLVIGIKFPALTINIPKLVITYRIPGQESIMKSDEAYVTFKSIFVTAIITEIGELSLKTANIRNGNVKEAYPDFFIGPAAYTSKDPIVTSAYADFTANIPLAVRNVFLFHSKLYALLYIQSICDFRLDLFSV